MARVAFPRPSPKGDDVLIASPISGFSNTLRNRGDFDAWLPLVAPTAKGGSVPAPPGVGVCCMCDAKIPVACKDCLDYARESVGLPAPDVQALRGQIESEVWEARKRVEAALSAEIVELRAQIDAARAEEREKMWLACSEVVIKAHQKHGYNDATGLIIAINNDLSALFDDVIRARSGARGAS